MKAVECLGQNFGYGPHDAANTQQATGPGGQCLDFIYRVVKVVQGTLSVANHGLAIGCGPHATGVAFEQLDAQTLFELLKRRRRRWLRGVDGHGRPP